MTISDDLPGGGVAELLAIAPGLGVKSSFFIPPAQDLRRGIT